MDIVTILDLGAAMRLEVVRVVPPPGQIYFAAPGRADQNGPEQIIEQCLWESLRCPALGAELDQAFRWRLMPKPAGHPVTHLGQTAMGPGVVGIDRALCPGEERRLIR